MAGYGVRHVDEYKTEFLFSGTPSTSTTLWIDMDLFSHVTFFIAAANTTGVSGSAITINQAQSSTGTNTKALAFNTYWQGTGGYATQATTADALVSETATGGTFTTATTSSTNLLYVIEVQDTDLDLTNTTASAPFNFIQLALATATATTITVIAHCYPRFGGNYAAIPSALV
jgi:hypothetical protein